MNRARKCVERCSLGWRVLQQHMLDDGPHVWDSEFDLTLEIGVAWVSCKLVRGGGQYQKKGHGFRHTESIRLVVGTLLCVVELPYRLTVVLQKWNGVDAVPGNCSQATAVPSNCPDTPPQFDTPAASSCRTIVCDSESNITWFPSSKRPATMSRVSQQFFLGQKRASGTVEERVSEDADEVIEGPFRNAFREL